MLSVFSSSITVSFKRFLVCFFSLSLIFFALGIYVKRAFFSSGVYGFTDFYTFYESVLFYFSGQNIYSSVILLKAHSGITHTAFGHSNLNPPFFVFMLLPLHYLNYAHALQLYSTVSIACMIVGGFLVFHEFPQWRKNLLPLMALFLIYSPNSETLAFGQVTAFLLVLLAGAWVLARNNQDGFAGILLGLACAIKLFCGLFLVYFFVLKRYRSVGFAIGTLLVTVILSGVVFGFHAYLDYHHTLGKIGWYVESWNDSFYGFFLRLFSSTEKNHALMNIPRVVPYLTAVVSAVLIAALWKVWIKINKTEKADFDVGFSLVIVSMLLLSPLGWGYYFPLLVIPYLVLVERGSTWVHLIACFILFVSMQTGDLIRPPQMQTLSQIFILSGLGFYVLLGMVLLLFYVGRDAYRDSRSAGPVISEALWILIYAVVFIPSFISLASIVRGLYVLHAL